MTLKKTIFAVCLFYFGFLTESVYAQLVIEAQLRPRLQVRDGYRKPAIPDMKPGIAITQRSRLMTYYTKDNLKTGFSFQDARIWGEVADRTDAGTLNISEAWAEYFFTENVSLKVGRQHLVYDNQLLLGMTNWNDVATSHDLALGKLHTEGFKLHLGFAYNNTQNGLSANPYYVDDFYRSMIMLWAEKSFLSGMKASFMSITEGLQDEESQDLSTYYRTTNGIYATLPFASDAIVLHGQGYYQAGEMVGGTDINAFYLGGDIAFKLGEVHTLVAATEYYSGTDKTDATNQEINTFDYLYGLNHGLRGYIDYFFDIPADTKGGGLMNNYFRLKSKFGNSLSTEVTAHIFSLANNAINSNTLEEVDPYLGTELDFLVKYTFSPEFSATLLYSTMFNTESMAYIRDGGSDDIGQWFAIVLNFTPTLFDSSTR